MIYKSNEHRKPTVLVVDDSPDNLTLIRLTLKDAYHVKVASNGCSALKIAQSDFPPNLILLDIMMPEMDGYEVCRQLKMGEKTRSIPVIFLTASSSRHDEIYGFKVGAIDYIAKPISPSVLLARVAAHLANKQMQDLLNHNSNVLVSELERQSVELAVQKSLLMHIINSLAESISQKKHGYSSRMKQYVFLLAKKLEAHPRFASYLNGDDVVTLLSQAAPLHGIGNASASVGALFEVNHYNSEGCDIIMQHPKIGRDILLKAELGFGQEAPFIRVAKEIVYSLHEKWDGTGYPDGLSEDSIPVSARIVALAETYDLMRDQMLSHSHIVNYIKSEIGGAFDPAIAHAFFELQSVFDDIYEGDAVLSH